MMVRFLQNVRTSNREIPAGTILDLEDRHFEKLRGMVQPIGETIAACQLDGDICRIRYTPDLYQKYRHRDGETITVNGTSVRLQIERNR